MVAMYHTRMVQNTVIYVGKGIDLRNFCYIVLFKINFKFSIYTRIILQIMPVF